VAAEATSTIIRVTEKTNKQHKKARRAAVRKDYEEKWQGQWEAYQTSLTHRTTAQDIPWGENNHKRRAKLTKVESTVNTLLWTGH
jgi:hypothetical protein